MLNFSISIIILFADMDMLQHCFVVLLYSASSNCPLGGIVLSYLISLIKLCTKCLYATNYRIPQY